MLVAPSNERDKKFIFAQEHYTYDSNTKGEGYLLRSVTYDGNTKVDVTCSRVLPMTVTPNEMVTC